jgi:hypothetical protein
MPYTFLNGEYVKIDMPKYKEPPQDISLNAELEELEKVVPDYAESIVLNDPYAEEKYKKIALRKAEIRTLLVNL